MTAISRQEAGQVELLAEAAAGTSHPTKPPPSDPGRQGIDTAKDPILFDGRATNLYLYIGADPINAADPMGLFRVNQAIRGGLAIFSGATFLTFASATAIPAAAVSLTGLGALSIGLGAVNVVSSVLGLQENLPAGPFELFGYVLDRAAQPCLDEGIVGSAQNSGRGWDFVSQIPGNLYDFRRGLRIAGQVARPSAVRAGLITDYQNFGSPLTMPPALPISP